MKIASRLALLLLCSVLTTVQSSRIDISSKSKGGGRKNGFVFVEDRGCSSTSKEAAIFSLSQASPASCLSSPIAALYSRLFLITADGKSCKPKSYWSISPASASVSSNPEVPFSYPASPAVQWKDAAGKSQTYQSWGTETSVRQDSSPQAPWAMRGADLTALRNTTEGLLKMLPHLLPPQYAWFGINATNVTLAPYKITATAKGFQAVLPTTGCTFTWDIAAGNWSSFTANKSTRWRPPADPTLTVTATSAMLFNTLCPAGAALQRQQCKMCDSKKNEVSLAVASTSCTRCPAGMKAAFGGRACEPACANVSAATNGTTGAGSNFFNSNRDPAGTCAPAKCPAGSWTSLNRDMCLASQNGALCVAASTLPVPAVNNSSSTASGRTPCRAPPAAAAAAAGVGAGVGGAALQLASYKADATACQPVKQLAQWLTTSKRLSFMGWNLAGDLAAAAAADAAAAGIRSQGLVWQLMGSWNASSVPLRPADDCSGTTRGPGPQAALTHYSDALDTNALLFSTVLATGGKRAARALPAQVLPRDQETAGYSIIAQPGSTPGTISTVWFKDSTVGADCMLNALSGTIRPQDSGTCQLDFTVVGGSVLGVAAKAATSTCPTGFHAVRQGQGSSAVVSCIACGPGQVYEAASKSCKACSGDKSWQGWWGDVASCGSCSGRASNGGIAGSGNWWCAGQRNIGWPRWNSA